MDCCGFSLVFPKLMANDSAVLRRGGREKSGDMKLRMCRFG